MLGDYTKKVLVILVITFLKLKKKLGILRISFVTGWVLAGSGKYCLNRR